VARFTFRLERVLELREREERSRQVALAAFERRRVELETQIRACAGRAREERALQAEMLSPGGADVGAARSQAAAAVHEIARAQRLSIELAGVLRKRDDARAALARAMADRRAIELLRERAMDEWRAAESRREDRELDDVSMAMTRRTMGQEG
jgi:flagellar export protein FliJ